MTRFRMHVHLRDRFALRGVDINPHNHMPVAREAIVTALLVAG